jgi:CBS domain-containing protein
MKLKEIMTPLVKTCSPSDTLDAAADVMWKNDCGCVPVVDASANVVGIVTDRDVAMAAYTQGRRLAEIPVTVAMAKKVLTCRADDDVDIAERTMRENQIRRVPIVDAEGRLQGIVSLNDIARTVLEPPRVGVRFIEGIVSTLALVSRPRPGTSS